MVPGYTSKLFSLEWQCSKCEDWHIWLCTDDQEWVNRVKDGIVEDIRAGVETQEDVAALRVVEREVMVLKEVMIDSIPASTLGR